MPRHIQKIICIVSGSTRTQFLDIYGREHIIGAKSVGAHIRIGVSICQTRINLQGNDIAMHARFGYVSIICYTTKQLVSIIMTFIHGTSNIRLVAYTGS